MRKNFFSVENQVILSEKWTGSEGGAYLLSFMKKAPHARAFLAAGLQSSACGSHAWQVHSSVNYLQKKNSGVNVQLLAIFSESLRIVIS